MGRFSNYVRYNQKKCPIKEANRMENNQRFTVAGTDIEEVKQKNAESGLSYKEVLEILAATGGTGTKQFSNADVEEVKQQINPH